MHVPALYLTVTASMIVTVLSHHKMVDGLLDMAVVKELHCFLHTIH